MAKRFNDKNIASKLDSLSENEFSGILEDVSDLEIARINFPEKADDLIVSLANLRENARARQVFEWETARRQTATPIFWQNAA